MIFSRKSADFHRKISGFLQENSHNFLIKIGGFSWKNCKIFLFYNFFEDPIKKVKNKKIIPGLCQIKLKDAKSKQVILKQKVKKQDDMVKQNGL